MVSAEATPSAGIFTSKPSARARAALAPGRAPITTDQPEPRKHLACAAPWLPYPMTQTRGALVKGPSSARLLLGCGSGRGRLLGNRDGIPVGRGHLLALAEEDRPLLRRPQPRLDGVVAHLHGAHVVRRTQLLHLL